MGQPSCWQPERFLLWIDAVGGYLICLKDTVVLGHASGGAEVDVPILAAISHVHARLRRDQEGYLLEPIQEVWVDGRQVDKAAWLRDGSRIQLGTSLRLRFRLPHPLSATARLEFLSPHRTEPRTDAVLLMAETCLLGRPSNCHIVCPQREKPVVLFRRQGGIYCRTEGWLELDGVTYQDHAGPFRATSRLRAEHLSLGVEAF
ncbi:MAG TPA: FHA domain-containing protein [Thermoguttaceae bacterium]|nr:FHA domain-containing protein [Thermoguttaceae bacterium]HPP51549.1 FHA domain-containing protein [Thermoguttaceae bacterium]